MRKQWSRFLRVVFCLSPSGCFPHLLLARESSLVWKRPCQGEQMQGGRSENCKDTKTHWNISPSGSCAAASFSFFYDFTFIIKKSVLPVQAGSWFVLLVVSQRCPFNFPCTNTWAKSSNACQARSKQLTKCVCFLLDTFFIFASAAVAASRYVRKKSDLCSIVASQNPVEAPCIVWPVFLISCFIRLRPDDWKTCFRQ